MGMIVNFGLLDSFDPTRRGGFHFSATALCAETSSTSRVKRWMAQTKKAANDEAWSWVSGR